MSLPLRGVAIYNPSLLSKDELIAQFVARKALLETILSELREQERPDHRILIGPRGMGKTTLLRRIYFAVEEEPALSRRWIALPFPEEQYNLTRLSDFYLNCVDALGDALMHLGRHAEAEALDRKRDALPDREEEERADAACKLLLSMADKLGRKLLLLVDNVEMVLDRLTESQWKLRELFGHDARLCLIGASAFAPEATYKYGNAFYEFFRFHELRPLQEEEAREVLLHLARVRRAPDIERVVNEEPARVRTLFALAGGNPRTLVQLYAVLAQSTEGDARSDLERLLDECTPIYKARFEALSIQAQQIVDAAALHWHPATAADLAAATRLDINVISSQISRLIKDGVLEAVAAAEGSRKAYQVTERFFNIWYLMRASRRQRQRLVWLVEFLRLLYGQDELPAHARKRLGAALSGDSGLVAREAEYRMALAQAVEDRALRRALVSSAVRPWAEMDGFKDKLAELLDLAPSDAPAQAIADRHKAMADLRRRIMSAKVKKKGWDPKAFWNLLGGSEMPLGKKWGVARLLHGRTAATSIDMLTDALKKDDLDLRSEVRCDAAVDALQHAIRDGAMDDAGDVDGGEAAALALGCPELKTLVLAKHVARTAAPGSDLLQRLQQSMQETPHMIYGWLSLAEALGEAGAQEAAEAAYRAAIELDTSHPGAWRELGVFLYVKQDQHRRAEAEAAIRKALELDPNDATAWNWLGDILSETPEHFAEAESAHRRAVKLDAARPWHWISLGEHLLTSDPEEAERACRKATKLKPELPSAWDSLGTILAATGRYEAAADAYRRAATRQQPWPWAWLDLGRVLEHRLNRPEEAEAAYRSAESSQDTRRYALLWLVRLRYRRGLVDAETEQSARDLVGIDSSAANKLLLATILVRRGLWDEPVQLARTSLSNTTEKELEAIWDEALRLFAEVIRSKGAAQALQLLADLGLAERWLPLHAALTAARDGKRALLGFAPEVRRPAEALLGRLEKPMDLREARTSPTIETPPSQPVKPTLAAAKPVRPAKPFRDAGSARREERPTRRKDL